MCVHVYVQVCICMSVCLEARRSYYRIPSLLPYASGAGSLPECGGGIGVVLMFLLGWKAESPAVLLSASPPRAGVTGVCRDNQLIMLVL